jgi:hypothetical protein
MEMTPTVETQWTRMTEQAIRVALHAPQQKERNE